MLNTAARPCKISKSGIAINKVKGHQDNRFWTDLAKNHKSKKRAKKNP
eukprot:03702.XXX_144647_144491_1 [CDS] Oithona nana genome sequencing.